MKRNKILSLYFGACAVGTGLFIPFGVLSLLFSFSKRNIAGSGVSAVGKLGKNVLTPALSNALPAVGLAISALDLFAKDNDSKTKEYLNKARDNNYENATINNPSYYINEIYKPKNSYLDDYKSFKHIKQDLPNFSKTFTCIENIKSNYIPPINLDAFKIKNDYKPYVPIKIDPILSYESIIPKPKPKPYVPINLDDFKTKFDF